MSISDPHDLSVEDKLSFEDKFEVSMRLGRSAVAAHDFELAKRHFDQAHVTGHDSLAQHIEVHRALLQLAKKTMQPLLIVKELYSLTALRLLGAIIRRKTDRSENSKQSQR